MIVLKSYFSKKRFIVYTMIIFTFSIIFLNVFILGVHCFGEYLKKSAREMYGDYHYCVYGVDKSVAESIKDERTSYKSTIFQNRISDDKYYIYCDEEYFELAGIYIVAGNFPTEKNQIMCNKSYMYSLGYSDGEMTGKKVVIDKEEYIVSGIADWQFYDDFDLSGGLFIYNINYNLDKEDDDINVIKESAAEDEYYYNVIVRNKDDNFLKEKNKIIKKYDLLKSQVGINVDYLLLSCRDESDRLTGMLRLEYYIFIIIVITLIFLNSGILLLAVGQLKKINYVYRKLGITKRLLYTNMIKSMCIALAISFLITNLLTYALGSKIFGEIKYVRVCILPQLFTYIIPIIFLIIVISYKQLKKTYMEKGSEKLSKIKKHINLDTKKNIYRQLAKNINFVGKGQYIFTVISAAFVGIVFVCMLFYGKILCMQLTDVNDFEYKLTYEGTVIVNEYINEYFDFLDNMRSEIEKIEDCHYIPICVDLHQDTIVEKSLIDKKYWDYLQKYNINVKEQLLTNNRYINIDVVTVGLEDYYCEFYGIKKEDFENLSESDCIVIRNVNIDNKGVIDNGIKENSLINMYYHENFEFVSKNLKVKYVYDNLDIKLENTENSIIVVVKNELLQKMHVYSFPTVFYIKCPKDKKTEVLNAVKGNPNIDIVDIGSFNNRIKTINNAVWWTVLLITISVIVFLVINIWIIMKTREEEMKKMRNILKVFGVSDKKILFVFLSDLIKMFIYSYLTTIVLSTILCYRFVKDEIALSIYFRYFIPYDLFGLLSAGIIIMAGIFSMQVKRYLTNMNIIQELKSEVSMY